jgi:hypothetical protein
VGPAAHAPASLPPVPALEARDREPPAGEAAERPGRPAPAAPSEDAAALDEDGARTRTRRVLLLAMTLVVLAVAALLVVGSATRWWS